MSEKDCSHSKLEVVGEEWDGGETKIIYVRCEGCGREGTITIDLTADNVEWNEEIAQEFPS